MKSYKIKVVIVGEPGVGKTSLVKRFISGQFSNDYRASIGTNMFIKQLELEFQGKMSKVSIQLWDIAGQERWINMRHIYYSGTQAALIVGDLSRKRTFEQIERFWLPDLVTYCGKIPFILIANKDDLKKQMTKEEVNILGEKLESKSNILTSAKTGKNVNHSFLLIAKKVINN